MYTYSNYFSNISRVYVFLTFMFVKIVYYKSLNWSDLTTVFNYNKKICFTYSFTRKPQNKYENFNQFSVRKEKNKYDINMLE